MSPKYHSFYLWPLYCLFQGPDGEVDFAQTVGDWEAYLANMTQRGTYADHRVIMIASYLYQVDFCIIGDDDQERWIHNIGNTDVIPLGFIHEKHYVTIVPQGNYDLLQF